MIKIDSLIICLHSALKEPLAEQQEVMSSFNEAIDSIISEVKDENSLDRKILNAIDNLNLASEYYYDNRVELLIETLEGTKI